MPLYQEGYHMNCQQSLNSQHSLKTQVRWMEYNGLIHSNSHQTLKKLDAPVWPITAIIQIPDVQVLKSDVPISTG
jgi:hypothetical protein